MVGRNETQEGENLIVFSIVDIDRVLSASHIQYFCPVIKFRVNMYIWGMTREQLNPK